MGRPAAEWAAAAIAPAAILAVALAVPPLGEVPLFDDWDYRETIVQALRGWTLRLSDWPSTTLVAHLAWGLPFAAVGGPSYLSLRISTLVATALAATALYFVARRLRAGRARAAALALALPFSPVAWLHANSFMTDLPGMAWTLGLLAAGARWFGGTQAWRDGPDRRRLLAFAALAGGAYLCRQTAALPAFALGAVFLCRWPRRTLAWFVLPTVAVVAAHWCWLNLVHGLPFFATWPRTDRTLLQSWAKFSRRAADVALGTGFLAAPALLFALDRTTLVRWTKDARARGGVALGAGIAGAACWLSPEAPLGDTLFDFGAGSQPLIRGVESLPHAAEPFGSAAWPFAARCRLLAALGIVAATGIAATAGRRRWRAVFRSSLPGMLLAAALAFLASLLIGMSAFDRYEIPLAVLGGLLATALLPAAARRRRPAALGGLALLFLAATSGIGVHDWFVRSRAYWAGLESLLAEGVSPLDINGSLEFGGVYRFAPRYRAASTKGPYLLDLPPSARFEQVATYSPHQIWRNRRSHAVAFAPVPGFETVRTIPFRGWSGAGAVQVLRRVEPPAP